MQRGELWGEGTWGEASVGSNQAYGIRISNSRTAINQKFMQEVGNPFPGFHRTSGKRQAAAKMAEGCFQPGTGAGAVCVSGGE